ncbi:hypothetical protein EV401DRAFT_2054431 [Pisolithus croceorrhizus]|nr:hypothetical protein EV401DRAFT_2054431 [Pisolithus croceorrhizus]
MTVTERHALEVLRELALNNTADEHVGDDYQSDGYGEMVLDGTEPLDVSHAGALVRHGLIPCSPITPKVAVTVHMLNLYHTTRQCCPHLLIQAYIKSLCNMHKVFVAFVSNLVCRALQHDQPDWRLKHSCPPCTYRLQDKPAMHFLMLFAQDRNDSLNLHRIGRWATDSDGNLCAECWKNMKDNAMQKMWNIFDKSGVFIAVCQHGFCLLIADMVQSGEQSKYALAVTSKLLDAFGLDLGGGYDIGCQFKTTLASSILGKCAQSLNYMSLVNAFHGHTHNRLCQLDNLMTYVEGLGLEDLEGCEWVFSKSNALALRQAIASYFEHSNEMEVYANLISDPAIFKLWLDEEHVYLKSLLHELPEETLQMEYWQWLINLATSRQDLKAILSTWTIITAQSAAPIWSDSSATRRRETMHCHAQENYEKDLKVVQELEGCLGITCCWVPEDKEWQAAAHLVANRKYQHALDNIDYLILTIAGYKLRKHIGKALQTRLAAIRAALTHYNTTVKALGRQTLEFDEVVEYAFLADFDLLRDTWQDVSTRPWALPTAQLTINTYFKLCWAEEEVVRLNVEICRIVTYLVDKDRYVRACEALYQGAHPALAYQISRYRTIHSQFTLLHLHYLKKISHLPGFNGMLSPGISTSCGLGDSASVPQHVHIEAILSSSPIHELAVDDSNERCRE